LWGIETKDRSWIGCVGLLPVSDTAVSARPDFGGSVEPIIALHARAWGAGYAAEALRAVIDHGFRALRLTRLVALVDEPNAASRVLMERVGFVEIGLEPSAGQLGGV
jgi:RimJ/RimL family protein N-acetyltransferase